MFYQFSPTKIRLIITVNCDSLPREGGKGAKHSLFDVGVIED